MAAGPRAQQRDQTRRTLIDVARRLFAAHGYANVGLAEIVAAAGVTKGALYHHFETKADLFHAVLAQVQDEVADTVVVTAQAYDDPWDQLLHGCRAFVVASTAPEVRRIMLVDGPAVLGWRAWRALDDAASARHLEQALSVAVAQGVIVDQPVAPLTRLLSGAMNEAALSLAGSTDPADQRVMLDSLSRLLQGLRRAA